MTTITIDRAAAQQALEALEQRDNATLWHQAIHALRDALAQEEPKESMREMLIGAAAMAVAAERKGVYPGASEVADAILAQQEQEPVAWMTHGDNTLPLFHKTLAAALGWGACPTPLYTHPPRREWQSLSEEEEKEIEDLRFRLDFYQRRCEALQSWQSKMRDPERTIVCDILANGFTLDPAFAGDRYTAPPQRQPLTQEEIVEAVREADLDWQAGWT